MVAGMSSRFGGIPKQFAIVGPNNESLIEYSVNQALETPFNKIIFIVSEKTESHFKDVFGKVYTGVPVEYVKQTFDKETRDKPWGTTDAVINIINNIDHDFIVCNGDDIYGEKAFKECYYMMQKHNTNISMSYKLDDCLPDTGKVNRGIFTIEQKKNLNYVKSIVETFNIERENMNDEDLERLANPNFLGLQYNVLEKLSRLNNEFKEKYKGDRKKESLIPETISSLINNKEMEMILFVNDEKCLGITNPGDEIILKELLK